MLSQSSELWALVSIDGELEFLRVLIELGIPF